MGEEANLYVPNDDFSRKLMFVLYFHGMKMFQQLINFADE